MIISLSMCVFFWNTNVSAAAYSYTDKILPVYSGAYYGRVDIKGQFPYNESTGLVTGPGSITIINSSCNTMAGGTSCKITPSIVGTTILSNNTGVKCTIRVQWYYLSGIGWVYITSQDFSKNISSPGPRSIDLSEWNLERTFIETDLVTKDFFESLRD